jgi:hypothetical protein
LFNVRGPIPHECMNFTLKDYLYIYYFPKMYNLHYQKLFHWKVLLTRKYHHNSCNYYKRKGDEDTTNNLAFCEHTAVVWNGQVMIFRVAYTYMYVWLKSYRFCMQVTLSNNHTLIYSVHIHIRTEMVYHFNRLVLSFLLFSYEIYIMQYN